MQDCEVTAVGNNSTMEPYVTDIAAVVTVSDDLQVIPACADSVICFAKRQIIGGAPLRGIYLQDCKVTAVDPNSEMEPYARDNAEVHGLQGFNSVQGLAEQLPFEDDTFDRAVCTLVLPSLPEGTSLGREEFFGAMQHFAEIRSSLPVNISGNRHCTSNPSVH